MNKRTKRGVVSLFMLTFLIFLSSCQVLGSEDRTTVERIQEEGVVAVGFANEQPYAY